MAEEQTSPALRYGEAAVVDGPTATPSSSPADRYKNYKVVDREAVYEGNIADATSESLSRAERITQRAIADTKNRETTGVGNFFNSMGRSTIVGPLADPIAALVLSQKFADEGITYDQALRVVRAQHEGNESTAGTIAGAVLGGGLIASGLKKGLSWAATKSGLARGMMQWGSKNKKLNRVVAAAGAGAAAGAVEEGIRTTLEEAVDASAGEAFDTERVIDNTVLGAFLGGVATPALQEGINGVKWFHNAFKNWTGNGDVQSYEAARRVIQSFAREGEDLDVAADRFRERVQTFRVQNGRMPAAAEIMAPEQVSDVAEVIRVFNGLDTRARKLGKEGVERALKDYDKVVTKGGVIPSPEFIEANMEDLFTDVMKRNGNTMVRVEDETMQYLMRNRDWIRNIGSNGNEGAAAMSKVLDARANIDQMSVRLGQLGDNMDKAKAFDEVNTLKKELAELLDTEFKGAEADPSRIGELRNLIQLNQALANKLASGRNASRATFDYNDFKKILFRTEAELQNYAENGLRIRLGDANSIRATASRHFNALRHGDPDKADAARRVRDAVAPVGKAEVPEYGDVVKRWNLEMSRSEAQQTGKEAARGTIDLLDLETRLSKGRIPGKPRAKTAEQRKATRFGAAEGTRREIQEATRGTMDEGVKSARRMAESPKAQKATELTLGKADSKAITQSAKQVVDTYEGMSALARPSSASEMAEERRLASEIFTGAAFGNLGGAGRAALYNRILTRLQIPRGTAKKMVEMLGNPDEIDKALAFMQKKGIRVGPLFSAVQAHLTEPRENE